MICRSGGEDGTISQLLVPASSIGDWKAEKIGVVHPGETSDDDFFRLLQDLGWCPMESLPSKREAFAVL